MIFNRSKFLFSLLTVLLFLSRNPIIGMDGSQKSSSAESPINGLPNETWETVMSFIKEGEPARAIKYLIQLRRVCTQWQEALSDEAIVRITGINTYTDRELVRLMYEKIIYPDDPDLLAFLYKTIFSTREKDGLNNTILLMTIEAIAPQCLEFILKKGANPNYIDNDEGWTPLHSLCSDTPHRGNQAVFCIQHLLTHKANINAQDLAGDTPLHLALANNHDPFIKLLVDHNPDVGITNNANQTILDAAREPQHLLTQYLLQTRLFGQEIDLDDTNHEQIAVAIWQAYEYDMFDLLMPLCQHKIANQFTPEKLADPLLAQALVKPTEQKNYLTYLVFLDLDDQAHIIRSTLLTELYQKHVQTKNYPHAQHILQLITHVPVCTSKHIRKILKSCMKNPEYLGTFEDKHTLVTSLCAQLKNSFDTENDTLAYDTYMDIKIELLNLAIQHSNHHTYSLLLDEEILPHLADSSKPIQYIDPLLTLKDHQLLFQFLDLLADENYDLLHEAITHLTQKGTLCMGLPDCIQRMKMLLDKAVNSGWYTHHNDPHKILMCALAHNNHIMIRLLLERNVKLKYVIKNHLASGPTGNPVENIFLTTLFEGDYVSQELKNYCLYQAIQNKLPVNYIKFFLQKGAHPYDMIKKYSPDEDDLEQYLGTILAHTPATIEQIKELLLEEDAKHSPKTLALLYTTLLERVQNISIIFTDEKLTSHLSENLAKLYKTNLDQLIEHYLAWIIDGGIANEFVIFDTLKQLIEEKNLCQNYALRLHSLFGKLDTLVSTTYDFDRLFEYAIKHNNAVAVSLLLQHNVDLAEFIGTYFKIISKNPAPSPLEDIFFKALSEKENVPQDIKNSCLYDALVYGLPVHYIEFFIKMGASPYGKCTPHYTYGKSACHHCIDLFLPKTLRFLLTHAPATIPQLKKLILDAKKYNKYPGLLRVLGNSLQDTVQDDLSILADEELQPHLLHYFGMLLKDKNTQRIEHTLGLIMKCNDLDAYALNKVIKLLIKKTKSGKASTDYTQWIRMLQNKVKIITTPRPTPAPLIIKNSQPNIDNAIGKLLPVDQETKNNLVDHKDDSLAPEAPLPAAPVASQDNAQAPHSTVSQQPLPHNTYTDATLSVHVNTPLALPQFSGIETQNRMAPQTTEQTDEVSVASCAPPSEKVSEEIHATIPDATHVTQHHLDNSTPPLVQALQKKSFGPLYIAAITTGLCAAGYYLYNRFFATTEPQEKEPIVDAEHAQEPL